MPDNVEENVVSLKFDNAGFAEKVGGTISILQKLREKLSFKGAETGLQQIDLAQKSMKFDGMANAIESINQKFSAMGAIAFSVLNNIVNRAISAGTQIANALSLGPLMDGFREYETNMGSIQTILSNTQSKGTTLEEVNAALQQLNEYSDKTIYNFAQMARNIGTFTAAGVDLDQSVLAIKGIANLAAISGSNAEQASTAMYQLSQALAAGKVSLMDWNSVVNAGMGGEVFKSALFDTAKAMGKVNFAGTFEEWEKAGNSFRDSLQSGWITSEVLTNTLSAFTGDLSEEQLLQIGYTKQQAEEMMRLGKLGVAAATEVKTITQLFSTLKEAVGTGWADSFRIIIGDFEEAKTLLTNINRVASDAIGKWSEARNDLLRGWKFLGGRDALINGLKEAMAGLAEMFRTIGGAWRDVFPKMDGWKLLELTNGFTNFVKSLIPTQNQLVHIRSIFQGVFSVLAIGWEIVKNVGSAVKTLFSSFGSNGGSDILWFFSDLGMQLKTLKEQLVDGGGIKEFFNKYVPKIAEVISRIDLEPIINGIKTAFQTIFAIFAGIGLFLQKLNLPEVIGKVGEAFKNIFDGFKDFLGGGEELDSTTQKLSDRWAWLGAVGEKLGGVLSWVADKAVALTGEIKNLIGSFAESFKTGNFDNITDALNVGILGGMYLAVKKFFDMLTDLTPGGFKEKFEGIMDSVTETLGAMQAQLKSEALYNIAKAVGVLAVSLLILSMIDSGDLTKALTATAVGFGQLATTMAVLTKIDMGPKSAAKLAFMGTALIGIAAALMLLSVSVKLLSTMEVDELVRGLIGVGALLTMVVILMKNMPDADGMISTGLGIAAIAVALLILVAPVKLLGDMPVERMIQGLIGVGLLLTGITLMMRNMPTQSAMIQNGLGIMAIAVALLILVAPVKLLGDMPVERMIQGFIGVALLLTAIVVAMNALPAANMAAIGLGLLLVAAGLIGITAAVFMLGNMDTKALIVGLIAIAGLLMIIAVAANAMVYALPGAIAILVISGALIVLATAMKMFSSIGWDGLAVALVGIVAVLLIFAVAANVLIPLIPGMIALGIAMVAFGVGLALIGGAVFLVGAGLFMLVKAIQALVSLGLDSMDGIIALVDLVIRKTVELGEAIFNMLMDLGKRFIDALPGIFVGIGEALKALLEVLRTLLPDFFAFANELITGILLTIRNKAPDFIETGLFVIESLLTGIRDHIKDISNAAVDVVLKFADTVKTRISELVTVGVDLIVAFLAGINEKVPEIALAGIALVVTIINAIAEMNMAIIDAGINLVVKLLEGIAEMISDVIDAGTNLVIKIIEGLGNAGTEIITGATNVVIGFLLGIAANYQKLIDAGGEMLLKILEGTTNKITEIGNAAADIVIEFMHQIADSIRENSDGFRDAGFDIAEAIISGLTLGLSDKLGVVIDGGGNLAEGFINAVTSKFRINSPSKVMIGIGNSLIEGLTVGIGQNGSLLQTSEVVGDKVVSAFQKSFEEISAAAESMEEVKPTITPVLDLTNIKNGAGEISKLVGQPELSATASLTQANLISEETSTDSSETSDEKTSSGDLNFYQTIHAPKELRTGDIYLQTKSQLVLAKEALNA